MLLMYSFLMPGIIGLEGFPEQGRCRQDYSRLAELPATNKAIPALPPRLQHLRPYSYRARLSLQRLEKGLSLFTRVSCWNNQALR